MTHHDGISSQFDPKHEDSDKEKNERADALADALDAHFNSLSDEERTTLMDRTGSDAELNSIRLISLSRAVKSFEDLPVYGQELATGFTMPLPTNPFTYLWLGERYRESFENAFEQPDEDTSEENRQTLAVETALIRIDDIVSSRVLHESVLEIADPIESGERYYQLKTGKSLGAAAKKHVKELFEEKSDALESIDIDTYGQTLNEIYLYTLFAGKKALYQQVADKLETIRGKNQLKLIESELPYLKDAVMLGLRTERTPEQQLKLETIIRERPMTGALALRDLLFLHTRTILRTIARHNNESLVQESMTTYVNVALADKIQTPDEKLQMMERACELAGLRTDDQSSETYDTLNLRPMELDWEVLPPGTDELEKTARQIVSDVTARTNKSPEIDLSRLVILDEIRKIWGEDASYYSRGIRQKRRIVKDNDSSEQPDEYIILVLQEINRLTGEVMYEHAVAESPIAGPNALYVYRQDATDHRHGWRTVMSLPKNQSRRLGARDIKHTIPRGASSLNTVMVGKVEQIMLASATDFHDLDFNGLDKDGQVKVRRILGRSAAFLTRQSVQ